jgi:5-methylcytosine-specific restriction protein B
MVQEPVPLVPFFRDLVQKNKVNTADWGDGYRKIVARVQREKPDFSDQTIQDLWYTRNNYISSLRQGGMSHDEFINAKADLMEITKLIAADCTAEVFNEALQRLQQLKDRSVLKKLYRALFCRVFAAFYPSRITTLISESVFFLDL